MSTTTVMAAGMGLRLPAVSAFFMAVSAIFMGKDYELAVYSNKDFIWDKTDLLVPAPGTTTTETTA